MTTVHTRTFGEPGAWLVKARHHHLVGGASRERGGDGQAWAAAELLLGALTGCAASIIADEAASRGVPLGALEIAAESSRDPQDRTRYAFIRVAVAMAGPTQAQATALVEAFTRACPIYGTLSRGAPVHFDISVRSA